MSDAPLLKPARTPTDWSSDVMQARIRRRYVSERRFRRLGLFAVAASAGFLAFLLIVMLGNGVRGFSQATIALPVDFERAPIALDPDLVRSQSGPSAIAAADFPALLTFAAEEAYGPGAANYFADGAWVRVREVVRENPDILLGQTRFDLPAASEIDIALKGDGSAQAEALVRRLQQRDAIATRFNTGFLSSGDATDSALAGIWGALKGSLLTMLVTLALAFPVGVLSALYLEEYAPRNRWTDIIEVSINNLAAVPSIIFGLLALAVFINFFGMPTSSPLVGGMTLALMTMPVIVIAGRNAVKSVPPSIRDAALGIGASKVQVVFHHVLPLALPGILTGTIIGMARALGETAPLLLIGMRAFIADPPGGFTDPSTVLPMQIFLWSDEVDRGFVEKTSAAIIVLLVVLLSMNAFAVYLRNRFEKRW